MTVQETRALVERFIYEVLQRLDASAIDELVAANFVSHTWGLQGDPREALSKVTAGMAGALSDIEFIIEDLIAEGDRVAARVTSSATQTGEFHGMPSSGRRYSIPEIHIFRIADGKIAEHWHQYDLPRLMEQLTGSQATK